MMRSQEIHSRIAWPQVLAQLGVPDQFLRTRSKHGPCPGCNGHDRYFFDNKHGRGEFFCRQCHPKFGDGFELLKLVFGWSFPEARKRVIEAAGLSDTDGGASGQARIAAHTHIPDVDSPAMPPDRVMRLRRDRCVIENCDDAVDYLESRGLWPLPAGCTLKAHSTVEYWHESRRIGRYPALVADVADLDGELVTVHVTYLQRGQKLVDHEPRKILSPLTGREGCAVRLMPAADVLGIAEGIETALSASVLEGIPVWAALNTSLLSKFEPPPGVLRLRVYGDRDEAGLMAALKLIERLQGRIRVENRIPPAPSKDWNDVLLTQHSRVGGKGLLA